MTKNCVINGRKEIAKRIVNTFYENECLGKPLSTNLVFREFIETGYDRPSIYHGLKLNTEFRIFYDFDGHRFIQGFNYWGDHDPMVEGLGDCVLSRGNPQIIMRNSPVLSSLYQEWEKRVIFIPPFAYS